MADHKLRFLSAIDKKQRCSSQKQFGVSTVFYIRNLRADIFVYRSYAVRIWGYSNRSLIGPYCDSPLVCAMTGQRESETVTGLHVLFSLRPNRSFITRILFVPSGLYITAKPAIFYAYHKHVLMAVRTSVLATHHNHGSSALVVLRWVFINNQSILPQRLHYIIAQKYIPKLPLCVVW